MKKQGKKTLAKNASFNEEQLDTSKCRARINKANLAECMTEMQCPWALHVGQTVSLVTQTFRMCGHPSAKQIAERTGHKADSPSSSKLN